MIERIDTSRTKVRNFGLVFAAIGALVGGYLLVQGSSAWMWWMIGAALFLLAGLAAYPVLRPVYVGWMMFAFALAWVNTRVLLGLFFYLAITPLGLMLRLFGKDLLDEKLDQKAGSYWIKRPEAPFDPKRYERLF